MAVRRDTKEATATRNKFYDTLVCEATTHILTSTGYLFIGMCAEGMTFKDTETGLYTIVKVVTKAPDFDGEDAIAEFKLKENIKAGKDARRTLPIVVTVQEKKKKA